MALQVLHKLLESDQLKKAIKEGGDVRLGEFKEPQIEFQPTYKMQEFVQDYKLKRTRTPSWTDRIIYETPKSANLREIKYESRPTVGSDHR